LQILSSSSDESSNEEIESDDSDPEGTKFDDRDSENIESDTDVKFYLTGERKDSVSWRLMQPAIAPLSANPLCAGILAQERIKVV
jgi:hypothetical protein